MDTGPEKSSLLIHINQYPSFLLKEFWLIKNMLLIFLSVQKQPSEVFYKKVVLQFRKIHKKTPIPEFLFWKRCRPQSVTFWKKRLWHRYIFCEFCDIYKNASWQNTSGRLFFVRKRKSNKSKANILLFEHVKYQKNKKIMHCFMPV